MLFSAIVMGAFRWGRRSSHKMASGLSKLKLSRNNARHIKYNLRSFPAVPYGAGGGGLPVPHVTTQPDCESEVGL